MCAMIGKGPRSEAVKQSMRRWGTLYFAAMGGAGALIAGCVKSAEVIAFDDLGCEAVRRLEVERLPVVCVYDLKGCDWYLEGRERYR